MKKIANQINKIRHLIDQVGKLEAQNIDFRNRLDSYNDKMWYLSFANATSLESKKALLSKWFYEATGDTLDLDNPITFNEKIQFLKIFDSTKEKSILSDKYEVRKIVSEKIGKQHLIKLIGIYDKFDDIDFKNLPNKFALKATHGSGYNLIVTDKNNLNLQEVSKKVNYWLSENFAFRDGLELHYAGIKPRLIIEEFCKCELEFQFWCFNGKPKFVSVIENPHAENKKITYDMNWKQLDFITSPPKMQKAIERPTYFNDLKKYANILCKNFAFVRVDFIFNGKNILFSELTFTPASGTCQWLPKDQNIKCGKMLDIKNIKPVLS